MKTRDRYLTGLLLILIGVFTGTLLTIYQQGNWVNDLAEVQFTEIKKSNQPAFTDEELEKLGERFLFKTVAERITPTVVYIETVVSVKQNSFSESQQDDFWGQFGDRRARMVGSGVIISPDGYILTNNHVVENAVQNGIQVVLNDKRTFEGRVVGADPTTDLAVVKIDARELPSIVIGDSDKIDVGEWVLAVGNPFRLRSTVTAGIVSALSRDVQVIDASNQLRIESFIQTDAAINRGNSGGALVNTSGELIGINTAIASQTGNYQGYGFAVPSNLAGKVASDIIEYGEVRRALLGVTIRSVSAYRASELGMETIRGVEIMSLTEDGAANEQNLKTGDVILSVNGTSVNEANELQEKIAVLHPGEEVELQIWRKGEVLEKEILLKGADTYQQTFAGTTTENEDTADQAPEENSGIINYRNFELGFQVMQFQNAENTEREGLIITKVQADSEAQMRGLKKGYKIVKVNNQKVENIKTLDDLVSRSLSYNQSVLLQIKTEDGTVGYYELKQER